MNHTDGSRGNAVPFSGTVSIELFEHAQKCHIGARWLLFVLIPVLLLLTFSYSEGRPEASAPPWLTLAIVFLVSIVSVPFIRSGIRRQWRRMYAKSPYLQDPVSGFFSAETFTAESATGRTEMPWARFVRVREGEDLLLLYPSPYTFFIVGRDFFASEDAWMAARAFALRGVRR